MLKKKLFFFLVLFLLTSNNVFADIKKYSNLDKLEFDIYRNNKLVGYHVYDFVRQDNDLLVKSKIFFEIKKLGVVFYSYEVNGKEYYSDNKFVKFESKTKQNKKNKFCNIFIQDDKFFIDGSSYKGPAPKDFMIGTWWNYEIINKKSQISAISGRIIKQEVNFLSEDLIEYNGVKYQALQYNFSSKDKKLSKNKKLNTNVWYDKETSIWLKASFENKGKWEYRLKKLSIF
tara:strand:+ start:216 stop:905 length:690 start_codon:yes stop_codon:yes gene_type:complete